MTRRSVPATLLFLGVATSTGTGCVHYGCSALCHDSLAATLDLSCSLTDLTDVTVSGPCSAGDAGAPVIVGTSLVVAGDAPGTCHVTLTFATGFVYSTDVVFVSRV